MNTSEALGRTVASSNAGGPRQHRRHHAPRFCIWPQFASRRRIHYPIIQPAKTIHNTDHTLLSTMTFSSSSAAASAKGSTTWNPRMSLLSSSATGLPYLLQGNPQASVPPMFLHSDGHARQDLRQILQEVLEIVEEDLPFFENEEEDTVDQGREPQDSRSSSSTTSMTTRGNSFPHSQRPPRSGPRE